MPKSGRKHRPSTKSAQTRRALVGAAKEILRTEGFAAATARAIAARAGCNPGLVFYHFDSVTSLLLAALDEVSADRKERYATGLSEARDMGELVALGARIFTEDLDSGDAKLLVEMVAGASSTPGLGPAVRARVAPWTDFASDALSGALGTSPLSTLLEPGQMAHLVVALYLGLELLSQLDGDRAPAAALFERARQLASLADVLGRP